MSDTMTPEQREAFILTEIERIDLREEITERRRSRDAALFASSWEGEIASSITSEPEKPPSVGIIEQDDDRTKHAFYRGKVNWLYGSNDSCKTWIAYSVVLERLKRGECAVIVDFEMGKPGVRARMELLGADKSDMDRLLVVCPKTGLSEEALTAMEGRIEQKLHGELAVVVFDAAASSIMMSNLDSNVARDVESWVHHGPRWIAERWPTAAVFVVDHTPKEGKEPTGTKRKSDTADAVYYVESKSRISRDQHGASWVSVKKDRQGFLPYELLFVFEGGGGEPWSIRPPKPGEAGSSASKVSEEDKRAQIKAVIEAGRPNRTKMDALKKQIGGSSTETSKRVAAMTAEGILDYKQGFGIAPGQRFDD